ncbi:hypothetical protein Mal52_53770 [Symmachiella dynata]|uniref:Uncharacterized protein n=1 Tax=Symmachiella dynata TaxID=2527995 RepID=A0A517ZWL1_9PLAN|nr:hypothetical protein [Symmachiella dynata]QDU46854.1 hypothetical protein Mal52_53770 [Symmachiella dynata]
MSAPNRIQSVFTEPRQWGLRGDPFLWKELRDHFSAAELPETAEKFIAQVELKIKDLTGSMLRGDQPIFVERYDAGGMSSGQICSEWWRETGIPLLQRQYLSSQTCSITRKDGEE